MTEGSLKDKTLTGLFWNGVDKFAYNIILFTINIIKASVIPIIPDITAEVMLVKAIFLNLISIVSFVSGTDMKAEIINCRDKTLNKRTNDGSL